MFCLSSRRACARIHARRQGRIPHRSDVVHRLFAPLDGRMGAAARPRQRSRANGRAQDRASRFAGDDRRSAPARDRHGRLSHGTRLHRARRRLQARDRGRRRHAGVARDALGTANFHCSPAATIEADGSYTVGAVTATASFRFAKWLDDWFKLSGCNIIIGKGGMTSEIYRDVLRAEQRDLSDDRRLRHRRAARPRHQARCRRLLARGAGSGAGGLGARRREIRSVPGRERSRRQQPVRAREREDRAAASSELYAGTRPATLRRYGETDDKTEEVI